MKRQHSTFPLQAVKLFAVLLLLVCFPVTSAGATLIYTIQTGSFSNMEKAQEQFDSLASLLQEGETDYLRIEKIGKFYSVRLGKFDNRHEAEVFHRSLKQRIPKGLLMDAYYKQERIKLLYQAADTGEPQTGEEPPAAPPSVSLPSRDLETEVKRTDEIKQAIPIEQQIRTASYLVENKAYEEALDVIEEALSLRPEVAEINGWYGTILLKLDKPAEAIKYMQKAAALSPGIADYQNGLGYCLFYLNKFNEAINAFNRALILNPSYVDALTGLGITYSLQGEKDKAMDAYDTLKGLDHDSAGKLLKIIEGI